MADGQEKSKLQDRILTSWMRTEPNMAANWYLDIAQPDEKQGYVDKIARNWSRSDPQTALNWLNQQTDVDQGESTLNLLRSASYNSTDFAINNLHLLDNDKDKLRLSSSIHRTLARNNPQKAAEFVEQSPVKEALEKKLNRYRKFKDK